MKTTLFSLLYILLFPRLQAQDQRKESLFFKLDKQIFDYKNNVLNRRVPVEGKQNNYTIYSFSIKCTCHPDGSLEFYSHTNKQYGDNIFKPVKTISKVECKKLVFISLDDLILLIKKYNNSINTPYNLYFVGPSYEKKGKYLIYHVRTTSTFIRQD